MLGGKIIIGYLAAAAAVAAPATISDGRPPERFTSTSAATVQLVDRGDVNAACGTAPEGFEYVACTRTRERKGVRVSTIIMPNPCQFPEERFAQILCHEFGHVNGWPASHGE